MLGLSFFPIIVHSQELFRFEKKPDESVTVYLQRLKVKDPNRRLDDGQRHELCQFFVRAYVTAKRRGGDELVPPEVPIFRLFLTNFPDVESRVYDSGIFLGQIVRFINTLPEYRKDLDAELRRDLGKQKCAHN
jgi:hypothetical protein